MNNNKKGFAGVLIVVLIAIVALGAGGYFYSKNKSSENPKVIENIPPQNNEPAVIPEQTVNNTAPIKNPTSQTNITPKTETNLDITASWKTYRNEQRKFSFKYPSDGKISEIGGGITLTVSIDRQAKYNLYFINQGRADDYSTYKVYTENKITIDGRQATERVVDSSGSGEITAGIETKRYMGSDGLERADGFFANFPNTGDANKALPEIEAIAKTLKYF